MRSVFAMELSWPIVLSGQPFWGFFPLPSPLPGFISTPFGNEPRFTVFGRFHNDASLLEPDPELDEPDSDPDALLPLLLPEDPLPPELDESPPAEPLPLPPLDGLPLLSLEPLPLLLLPDSLPDPDELEPLLELPEELPELSEPLELSSPRMPFSSDSTRSSSGVFARLDPEPLDALELFSAPSSTLTAPAAPEPAPSANPFSRALTCFHRSVFAFAAAGDAAGGSASFISFTATSFSALPSSVSSASSAPDSPHGFLPPSGLHAVRRLAMAPRAAASFGAIAPIFKAMSFSATASPFGPPPIVVFMGSGGALPLMRDATLRSMSRSALLAEAAPPSPPALPLSPLSAAPEEPAPLRASAAILWICCMAPPPGAGLLRS